MQQHERLVDKLVGIAPGNFNRCHVRRPGSARLTGHFEHALQEQATFGVIPAICGDIADQRQTGSGDRLRIGRK